MRKILKSRRSERIGSGRPAAHPRRGRARPAPQEGGRGARGQRRRRRRRSPTARRWRATPARATCRRWTGAPRRRWSISPAGERARGELPPDQRRHRGARAGLLSDLRRVPAAPTASGSRWRRSRRTRTATWKRWRPGWSGRCPTGAAGWRRCWPPKRRSTRVSWRRSRTRCRQSRTQWRSFERLAPTTSRGILRRVRRSPATAPTSRSRSAPSTRTCASRPTPGRCSCASTRASREDDVRREAAIVAHAAARGVPTPVPRADAAGALFARWGDELVSLFPWVAGRTLARAELTPAHAAAVGDALAAAAPAPATAFPTIAPAATSPPRSTRAWRASRRCARPELAPAVAVLEPELARLRAGARRGHPARDHPRRSVRRQRALRRRRRADRADRLRAGVVGAPGLRPGGDDAGVRLSAATTSAPRSCAR